MAPLVEQSVCTRSKNHRQWPQRCKGALGFNTSQVSYLRKEEAALRCTHLWLQMYCLVGIWERRINSVGRGLEQDSTLHSAHSTYNTLCQGMIGEGALGLIWKCDASPKVQNIWLACVAVPCMYFWSTLSSWPARYHSGPALSVSKKKISRSYPCPMHLCSTGLAHLFPF